jgi:hypothetical protein
MRGEDEMETLKVHFNGCEQLGTTLKPYKYVITVAPNMPLNRAAKSIREIGGAPNAALLHIAGSNADQLFRRMSYFEQLRISNWPTAQRFYEYYMREQWDLFVVAGKKAVGPEFTDPGTAHGRESEAFRAVTICTLPATTDSFGPMMDEIIELLKVTLQSPAFKAFAISSVTSGDLQHEQRRIWDCLCLLMRLSKIWFLPGVLWDLAEEDPRVSLNELSLSLDEFNQLRDIYITCFEACCKAMVYIVAFINTAQRGAPEAFMADLPLALRLRENQRPTRTLIQFKRLPNAEKLTYLYEWPALSDGFKAILDSRLRNALGHNSVRHDLRTDMVVNDNEDIMSYFEFTARVYRLNTALQIVMTALHSVRMAATQRMQH